MLLDTFYSKNIYIYPVLLVSRITCNPLMIDNILIPEHPINRTPLVDFKTTGEMQLIGKSFPENPAEFYEPLLEWVVNLKKESPPRINMTVRLDYFNTSSSKLVLLLFKHLEDMHLAGKSTIKIVWLYNRSDEDQFDSGIDYQSIIDVPFELVEY